MTDEGLTPEKKVDRIVDNLEAAARQLEKAATLAHGHENRRVRVVGDLIERLAHLSRENVEVVRGAFGVAADD